MRMPLLFPTLILAVSLTFPPVASSEETRSEEMMTDTQTDPPPVSDVGRYRLFDGQLIVANPKGPDTSERHLLKIDTVTGQTWVGRQVQYLDKKGKVVQQRYWEPFEQYLEAPVSPAAAVR